MDMAGYASERDDILRALDVERFNAFWARHNMPMPSGGWADPVLVPMIMMHKCRLQVGTMTEAEKALSRDWLTGRGFSLTLGDGM
jgi:hypothetical protein